MSSVQAVVVASGEARVVRGSYRSLSARGRGPRDTAGLSAEQCCMTSLRTVFLVQQSSSSRRGIRPTGGRVRYGPTKGKYYTVLLRGCALIVSKIVEASRSGANRGQDQDSRASGRREGPSPVSFTSDTFSSQKEASRKRAACVRRLGIASRVLRRAGGTRPRDICVTGQRVLVTRITLCSIPDNNHHTPSPCNIIQSASL